MAIALTYRSNPKLSRLGAPFSQSQKPQHLIKNGQNQNTNRDRECIVPAKWIGSGNIASFFYCAMPILVALAGLVVYEWLVKQDRPPVLSVTRSGASRSAQGHFYVPFAVTNTGGGTAQSVQIIAQLRFKGKVEATGEQQIDFLSSGETEKGAFVFNRNPGDGELILRVASYQLP